MIGGAGVVTDDSGSVRRRVRRTAIIRILKILVSLGVVYFLILNIPGLRNAFDQLNEVEPRLLLLGLALELLALFCYSVMTKVALGPIADHLPTWRLFRIQLSTRALSSLVPGGSAAGSALGYRLLTVAGIPGPDAGFALATSGLASAVVLNLILWSGLIISIPIRGVNPIYGTAAVAGIILMGIAVAVIFGLIEGQERSERILRAVARRLRLNEDRAGEAVRHIGSRMQELASDRPLLRRLVAWAAANWLIDAAALWVFLRSFGGSVSVDGLIVAFGLANVLAAVPITPGGLGVVEATYVPVLVGFGLSRATVVVGVLSYRIAQYWLPLLLGGVMYLSLRVGPWAIDRQQLDPLRDVVATAGGETENILDFSARYPARERTGQITSPSSSALDEAQTQRMLAERRERDGLEAESLSSWTDVVDPGMFDDDGSATDTGLQHDDGRPSADRE